MQTSQVLRMNKNKNVIIEQVKAAFKIAWEDEDEPEKGFKYIYLSPDDYARLASLNSVKAQLIEDGGESRYKLTDIIGIEDGLGVENLKYAGMIAGETSRAYQDVCIQIGLFFQLQEQNCPQTCKPFVFLTLFSLISDCYNFNCILSRDWYWFLSSPSWTESYTDRELPHYPDRIQSTQFGFGTRSLCQQQSTRRNPNYAQQRSFSCHKFARSGWYWHNYQVAQLHAKAQGSAITNNLFVSGGSC